MNEFWKLFPAPLSQELPNFTFAMVKDASNEINIKRVSDDVTIILLRIFSGLLLYTFRIDTIL